MRLNDAAIHTQASFEGTASSSVTIHCRPTNTCPNPKTYQQPTLQIQHMLAAISYAMTSVD